MCADTFIIQKFCISPTGLFSCVFHMIHAINSECIHQHVGPSACVLIHLTPTSHLVLGWACSRSPLCKPFLLPARSTCLLQTAVCVTDWFSGQSSPFFSPPPGPIYLTHTHNNTHTKWNFIIKHLFACSWDSLKRFRRKAFRGNEPNSDVYRSFIRRVYQYAIQVYNWTMCTMVS